MNAKFAILVLVLGISCYADTLRLRNGSIVNGTFLGGTAQDVQFQVNDEIQHFPRTDIAEIIFGASQAPSAGQKEPRATHEGPKIDTGPDIVGTPFLRGSSGYIPLEREIGMMSRGGGMYGMGAAVYRIQGPRSPVRVRQGDRIVFVVRLNSGADPRQFQLYRLESRMNYRQTQPTSGGPPPGLPVTINQIGDDVYEILPARVLYPGEYAISPMNSNESYCFGIDY